MLGQDALLRDGLLKEEQGNSVASLDLKGGRAGKELRLRYGTARGLQIC